MTKIIKKIYYSNSFSPYLAIFGFGKVPRYQIPLKVKATIDQALFADRVKIINDSKKVYNASFAKLTAKIG